MKDENDLIVEQELKTKNKKDFCPYFEQDYTSALNFSTAQEYKLLEYEKFYKGKSYELFKNSELINLAKESPIPNKIYEIIQTKLGSLSNIDPAPFLEFTNLEQEKEQKLQQLKNSQQESDASDGQNQQKLNSLLSKKTQNNQKEDGKEEKIKHLEKILKKISQSEDFKQKALKTLEQGFIYPYSIFKVSLNNDFKKNKNNITSLKKLNYANIFKFSPVSITHFLIDKSIYDFQEAPFMFEIINTSWRSLVNTELEQIFKDNINEKKIQIKDAYASLSYDVDYLNDQEELSGQDNIKLVYYYYKNPKGKINLEIHSNVTISFQTRREETKNEYYFNKEPVVSQKSISLDVPLKIYKDYLDIYPFAIFRYSDDIDNFDGISLVENLIQSQKALNLIGIKERALIPKLSTEEIFYSSQSKLSKENLQGDIDDSSTYEETFGAEQIAQDSNNGNNRRIIFNQNGTAQRGSGSELAGVQKWMNTEHPTNVQSIANLFYVLPSQLPTKYTALIQLKNQIITDMMQIAGLSEVAIGLEGKSANTGKGLSNLQEKASLIENPLYKNIEYFYYQVFLIIGHLIEKVILEDGLKPKKDYHPKVNILGQSPSNQSVKEKLLNMLIPMLGEHKGLMNVNVGEILEPFLKNDSRFADVLKTKIQQSQNKFNSQNDREFLSKLLLEELKNNTKLQDMDDKKQIEQLKNDTKLKDIEIKKTLETLKQAIKVKEVQSQKNQKKVDKK